MLTKKHRMAGFTLIEMMMVGVIMVILATLAGPSFIDMFANNRITSATNELVADLALARNEAVKRGGTMTVCASADGTTCSGSNNDWTKWRLVYIGTYVASVTSTDIIRKSSLTTSLTITIPTAFTTTGFVSYTADGAITSTAAGTFRVCQSGYIGREVSVSRIGRSSLAKTASTCS